MEQLPVFKALCRDNPDQNAGPIHASNPEYLLVLKALRGADPEQNKGTIHMSNPEHLLILKAPCGTIRNRTQCYSHCSTFFN